MNVQRTIPPPPGDTGYDTDFLAWLDAQADALRAGDPARLDWPNLLEEIEALAGSERRELLNRLTTIIEHLLKYRHGLNRDPAAGWERTLTVQRPQLARHLKQSPSLRRLAVDSLQEVHTDARRQALASFKRYEPHRLDDYRAAIPEACPYTLDQIVDLDYLPEPPSA